jgi:hypothetical protein
VTTPLKKQLIMPGIAVRRTASLPLAYVPGIYVLLPLSQQDVDGRDKPGHDENAIRGLRA